MPLLPARLRLTRTLVVAVVAMVLVLGGLGAWWWSSSAAEGLERAARVLPEETSRMTYVDWVAVRAELDAPLSSESSAEEVDDLLAAGFDRDLTMPSSLGASARALHERFGLSPATLAWEALGQSPRGAVLVLALGPETEADDVRDRLVRLGYAEPGDDDGVWRGGPEVVARVDGTLNEIFGHLAVLDGPGLVLASDDPSYLSRAVRAAQGDEALDPGEVVAAAGEPLAAIHFVGDHGCAALAMSQAHDDEQATATELVGAAGKVNPYRGLVVSAQPDGALRADFGFASGDQARTNATSRARLAEGPAPGQGGAFSDRFTLDSATASGSVVTLVMTPTDAGTYAFSDITSGPVLFATC